ncbi:hypothetical protein GH714_032161 [Hevea brasiliensis]|uniref:Protein FAR1-RELATED SEQUENCE n=1 Tax=Hevea brasiliensis TaxID=3981 RepID=A0A6A6N494_HEVBR|nr:hypothetical protein GH714_032161 [Hevea brasiliensis]
MGRSNSNTVRRVLVDIFGRSQSKSQIVNECANGDELSYGQYEDGNQTKIMEEESEENEAKEESQVGEASDGNGNQISVIHDENQQIELAGHDQPPSVGMYYASVNVLFDAYLFLERKALVWLRSLLQKAMAIMWLVAMGGRAPSAIMTYQCESMKSIIREVMPNTTHRFCIWHILCKVPEKLRGVQGNEWLLKLYNERQFWVPVYVNHIF